MLEELGKYIYKNFRIIGLVVLAILAISQLVEVIDNFNKLGELTLGPFEVVLLFGISLLIALTIGLDKRGKYSILIRKLARLLVVVWLNTVILYSWFLVRSPFLLYEYLFWRFFIVFVAMSFPLFFVIDYFFQKPRNFNILFCEFSEGANKEKPKNRIITHFVREGLRKRFKGTEVTIIELDEVVTEETRAQTLGTNAEAVAVIYGIYTQVQADIRLDLNFLVIKRPEYYQLIELERRSLRIEELTSGRLETLVGNDYANITNFLIGLFEYSSGDFRSAAETFRTLAGEIDLEGEFSSLKKEIVYLYLGNSHFLLGDLEKGKSFYETALSIRPDIPKIIHNIAVIEYQSGNFDRSIEYFTKALSFDKQLVVAYRNRAFVLILKEKYQEALSDLSYYLASKPFDADALKYSAICHENLGDHTQAIRCFKFAHKFQSRDINIVFDLADEYIETKNSFGAFALPLSQLYRGKKYSRIFGYLGDISRELNCKKWAEVFYTIALIFDKKKYFLYYSRSKTKYDLGRFPSAKKDLEKAIRLEPNMPDAYLDLGNIYMRQGSYDAAEENYSKGVALAPNSSNFYLLRAQALFALQKYHEVILDCENYMRLRKSENLKSYQLLGYSYWALSRFDEAIEYLDKAYQLSPSEGNKTNLANVHLAYAAFLSDSDGDSKEILHHYEIAQSLRPQEKLDEELEQK